LILSLHLLLDYLGGSLFTVIGHVLPLTTITLLVLGLLVIAFVLWVVAYRWQKATRGNDVEGTLVELWHEGICSVCLVLYTANQLRAPLIGRDHV
jgi:hypothetical protein